MEKSASSDNNPEKLRLVPMLTVVPPWLSELEKSRPKVNGR